MVFLVSVSYVTANRKITIRLFGISKAFCGYWPFTTLTIVNDFQYIFFRRFIDL